MAKKSKDQSAREIKERITRKKSQELLGENIKFAAGVSASVGSIVNTLIVDNEVAFDDDQKKTFDQMLKVLQTISASDKNSSREKKQLNEMFAKFIAQTEKKIEELDKSIGEKETQIKKNEKEVPKKEKEIALVREDIKKKTEEIYELKEQKKITDEEFKKKAQEIQLQIDKTDKVEEEVKTQKEETKKYKEEIIQDKKIMAAQQQAAASARAQAPQEKQRGGSAIDLLLGRKNIKERVMGIVKSTLPGLDVDKKIGSYFDKGEDIIAQSKFGKFLKPFLKQPDKGTSLESMIASQRQILDIEEQRRNIKNNITNKQNTTKNETVDNTDTQQTSPEETPSPEGSPPATPSTAPLETSADIQKKFEELTIKAPKNKKRKGKIVNPDQLSLFDEVSHMVTPISSSPNTGNGFADKLTDKTKSSIVHSVESKLVENISKRAVNNTTEKVARKEVGNITIKEVNNLALKTIGGVAIKQVGNVSPKNSNISTPKEIDNISPKESVISENTSPKNVTNFGQSNELDNLLTGEVSDIANKEVNKVSSKEAGILAEKSAGKIASKEVGTVVGKSAGKIASKEAGAVAAKGLGKLASKEVGVVATKGLGKLASKEVGKVAAKGLGKSLLKKIPGVGLLMGAGLGISRLMKGDVVGAVGEVASGAVSTIPGVGTAASTAIDVGLAAKDAMSENGNEKVTTESSTPASTQSQKQTETKKSGILGGIVNLAMLGIGVTGLATLAAAAAPVALAAGGIGLVGKGIGSLGGGLINSLMSKNDKAEKEKVMSMPTPVVSSSVSSSSNTTTGNTTVRIQDNSFIRYQDKRVARI